MFSVLCSLFRQGRVTAAQVNAYAAAGAITTEQAGVIIASGGNCGAWLAAQAAEADAPVDAEVADAVADTAAAVEDEA